MNELSVALDKLALTCYYRNEFRHAYTYGKMALDLEPEDTRLQDNMKWYESKYTPRAVENRAWVTLLSDNSFINGVVVLHRSLMAVNSIYPLYVAVTPDVSEENLNVLHMLNIPIIEIDILCPSSMKEEDAPDVIESLDTYGWHKALCKLHVFGLEEFDKLVFIDADMIVKHNMDELFEFPHLTACRDCCDFEGPFGDSTSLNSGLMVIEPDKQVEENIITFLDNFDSHGKMIHDQWIIQEYYTGWIDAKNLILSPFYGSWTTRFVEEEPYYYYHMHEVKSLHMVDRKPWRTDKDYFLSLMERYPIYARLCLQYIDILNFTIRELEKNGITSSDLKIIN